MTRDDIIRMARCSGSGIKVSHEKDVAVVTVSDLEDFARRARAADRQRIEAAGTSLYERTGDILDINTLLIQRNVIRADSTGAKS